MTLDRRSRPAVRSWFVAFSAVIGGLALVGMVMLLWSSSVQARASAAVAREVDDVADARALREQVLDLQRLSNLAASTRIPEVERERARDEAELRAAIARPLAGAPTAQEKAVHQEATVRILSVAFSALPREVQSELREEQVPCILGHSGVTTVTLLSARSCARVGASLSDLRGKVRFALAKVGWEL